MAVNRTPAAMPATTFSDLGLPAALVDVLAAEGITAPFPIQQATLPDSLAGLTLSAHGVTVDGCGAPAFATDLGGAMGDVTVITLQRL